MDYTRMRAVAELLGASCAPSTPPTANYVQWVASREERDALQCVYVLSSVLRIALAHFVEACGVVASEGGGGGGRAADEGSIDVDVQGDGGGEVLRCVEAVISMIDGVFHHLPPSDGLSSLSSSEVSAAGRVAAQGLAVVCVGRGTRLLKAIGTGCACIYAQAHTDSTAQPPVRVVTSDIATAAVQKLATYAAAIFANPHCTAAVRAHGTSSSPASSGGVVSPPPAEDPLIGALIDDLLAFPPATLAAHDSAMHALSKAIPADVWWRALQVLDARVNPPPPPTTTTATTSGPMSALDALNALNATTNTKAHHSSPPGPTHRLAVLLRPLVNMLKFLTESARWGSADGGTAGGEGEDATVSLSCVASLLGKLRPMLWRMCSNAPISGTSSSSSSSATTLGSSDAADDDVMDDDDAMGEMSHTDSHTEHIPTGVKGFEAVIRTEMQRLVREAEAQSDAPEPWEWQGALQVLTNKALVSHLFAALLPRPDTTSSDAAMKHTSVQLAAFYADLLSHMPPAAPEYARLLAALSRRGAHNMVPRLWLCVERSREEAASAGAGASSSALSSSAGPQHHEARGDARACLHLLCNVLSRQLITLDDHEVFDRGQPVDIATQRTLVTIMSTTLHREMWDQSAILEYRAARAAHTASPNPAHAFAFAFGGPGGSGGARPSVPQPNRMLLQLQRTLSMIRLFNQMYDRHARRDFKIIARDEFVWSLGQVGDNLALLGDGGVAPADERGSGTMPTFSNPKVAMVLTCIPQVIEFNQRVVIFQKLIEEDRARLNLNVPFMMGGTVSDVSVKRETIYQDAIKSLNHLGRNLKGRIRVTFESELGYQEAGIDGGGLFRDFMDALAEQAFDPSYGFFNVTEDHLLHPNPSSRAVSADHLSHYEFIGRVLGKAVYEQILVKPQFALFFLNKLLDRTNHIDDLYTLDPQLYKNLMSLKDIARSGNSVEDLTLYFVTSGDVMGAHRPRELVPGGAETLVTSSNYPEYQYRYADFKLNREIAQQSRAFLRGFHDLIPVDWIRMFDARELQMVIGGESRFIDMDNLEANVNYSGGYHPSQPIIQWFWNAMRSFTPEEQSSFLKFVTSSSRQPLLGFQYLHPPICIQKVPVGEEGPRLPTAATCMNLLKLPEYTSEAMLREKLLYAISANAGFEMS